MHWNAERKCVRGGREALHSARQLGSGARLAAWTRPEGESERERERGREDTSSYVHIFGQFLPQGGAACSEMSPLRPPQ